MKCFKRKVICTLLLLILSYSIHAQRQEEYMKGLVSDPGLYDLIPGLSSAEYLELFGDLEMSAKEDVGGIPPQPLNLDSVKRNISYPALARDAEISGEVYITLKIDTLGKAVSYFVRIDPHPILTKAVKDNIMSLRFSQGRNEAGKPIPVYISIPFDFRLTGFANASNVSYPYYNALHSNQLSIVFANWKLGYVPKEILQLTKTENLILSGCDLQEFPKEILKMKNLKRLRLDENPISSLPEELFELPHLQFIDLRGTAIPYGKLKAYAKMNPGKILY